MISFQPTENLQTFAVNKTEMLAHLEGASGDPPTELSPELKVLWLVQAGNWQAAHTIAQDLPDPHGAWLHAHLHRHEGDLGNAAYWYHRANKATPASGVSLHQEWRELVLAFSA